jgi:hypothetical protein
LQALWLDKWQFGHNKLFLKFWHPDLLDRLLFRFFISVSFYITFKYSFRTARYSEKAGCLQRAWRRIQARRLLQKLRDAAARNRNAANYFFEEMGLGIQAVGRVLEVIF